MNAYFCSKLFFLRKSFTIQPYISALLILVFACAITPKRYLHNLVVSHKDTYNKLVDEKTRLHKAGINCQCDDLVATSPFSEASESDEIILSCVFVSRKAEPTSLNLFPAHTYFNLRGPPAFRSIAI